jgi:ubiquinone/menaquinone biosynthesis C-methylase UbiE
MSKMTWEETVINFRSQPKNKQTSEDAYIEEDLVQNIERFRNSEEYKQTIIEIRKISNQKNSTLLDIGAGNGISSIAFALDGYTVTALEPDDSKLVGAGAIEFCKQYFKLDSLSIIQTFGETLPFDENSFDIVYGRQVMHHAYDLDLFVSQAYRVLKRGGIFMTTRDHVIKNEVDKQVFLKKHPLHKFYGGENAFRIEEYKNAMLKSGFEIRNTIGPSDSPINYDPWNKQRLKNIITSKLGSFFGNNNLINNLAWRINLIRLNNIAGRVYSFICIKS